MQLEAGAVQNVQRSCLLAHMLKRPSRHSPGPTRPTGAEKLIAGFGFYGGAEMRLLDIGGKKKFLLISR